MKKDQLKLKGTVWIIVGMCFMLFPVELIMLFPVDQHSFAELGTLLDFFGFLLITCGLYNLHRETGGFTLSIIAGTACSTASFIFLWNEVDHLTALLPQAAYCVLLYLMCTNYAKHANRASDEFMSHHFISHMWIDIVVTAIEITAHAMGIHGFPTYIFILICLYCEFQLMLHMYRFYKKYNGFHLDENLYNE